MNPKTSTIIRYFRVLLKIRGENRNFIKHRTAEVGDIFPKTMIFAARWKKTFIFSHSSKIHLKKSGVTMWKREAFATSVTYDTKTDWTLDTEPASVRANGSRTTEMNESLSCTNERTTKPRVDRGRVIFAVTGWRFFFFFFRTKNVDGKRARTIREHRNARERKKNALFWHARVHTLHARQL